MKKRYLTSLLVLLAPTALFGQYYQQYFDGADTSAFNAVLVSMDTSAANVWQTGPPQKVLFNAPATAPNVLVTDTVNPYPPDNTSHCYFKVWNQFVPWGILAIQWLQKLDLDAGTDGGLVEFSVDSGNTWQNAFNNPYVYNFYGFDPMNADTLLSGDMAFTGTDTAWKNVWLCFDLSWMSFMPDTIRFRFTLASDSVGNGREGWMIDNMVAYITGIHTVNETEQEKYMVVEPNPTTGRVDIHTRQINEFHIIEHMELTDAAGRLVRVWTNCPTRFFIDLGDQPDGIYHLKVKTNIQTESFRIVKQRP